MDGGWLGLDTVGCKEGAVELGRASGDAVGAHDKAGAKGGD
jgi:hypothetical protein